MVEPIKLHPDQPYKDKELLAETKKRNEQKNLLAIMQSQTTPFVLPSGEAWVSLERRYKGGYEHHPVCNTTTEKWLLNAFFEHYGLPANPRHAHDVLQTFEAQVCQSAPTRQVYMRVAPDKDGAGIWLDLGDYVNGVHITKDGWKVEPLYSDFAFLRPVGYEALPEPERGGSIDELRPYMNCPITPQGDANWHMMVAWLVDIFRPEGDRAILVVNGESGSGKTSVSQILRLFIDPNTVDTSTAPNCAEDIRFQGARSWIVAYDNLRSIPDNISDAFCRLTTGMGDAKRKLYTDDDAVLWNVKRSAVINGLHSLIVRSDLASRSLVLNMPPLDEDTRGFSKTELMDAVKAKRARILGALLDAVVVALRRLPGVRQSTKQRYRLADTHLFVKAAEPALGWPEGTMDAMMAQQKADTQHAAVSEHAVLEVLLDLFKADATVQRQYGVSNKGGALMLEGKATDLLAKLTAFARNEGAVNVNNPKVGWPQQAKKLTQILRSSSRPLETQGVHVSERLIGGTQRFTLTYGEGQNRPNLPTTNRPVGEVREYPALARGEGGEVCTPLFSDEEKKGYKEVEEGCHPVTSSPSPATNSLESTTLASEGLVVGKNEVVCPSPLQLDDLRGWQPRVQGEWHLKHGTPGFETPWKRAYALLPTCPVPGHYHSHPTCHGLPIRHYPSGAYANGIAYKRDEQGMIVGYKCPNFITDRRFTDAAVAAYALAEGNQISAELRAKYDELVEKACSAWLNYLNGDVA